MGPGVHPLAFLISLILIIPIASVRGLEAPNTLIIPKYRGCYKWVAERFLSIQMPLVYLRALCLRSLDALCSSAKCGVAGGLFRRFALPFLSSGEKRQRLSPLLDEPMTLEVFIDDSGVPCFVANERFSVAVSYLPFFNSLLGTCV